MTPVLGVLQRTTPVPFCTTNRTLAYYKVLRQYCSVLQSTTTQSTTPVLFCSTKYYSSAILFYKVLLQYYSLLQSITPGLQRTIPALPYYSVIQSTTPVLLRTTKYYSSTTWYYKVLLQYYFVLPSTTPVLFRTTNYKVLLQYCKYYASTCTTKYYSVLLCTTQFTPYYSTTSASTSTSSLEAASVSPAVCMGPEESTGGGPLVLLLACHLSRFN